MNTDVLRQEIRAQLKNAWARHQKASTAMPAVNPTTHTVAPGGVVVPLCLRGPGDGPALTQLIKRLAASPGLIQMVHAGLLRFEWRFDIEGATATTATETTDPSSTCCNDCKSGRACECAAVKGTHAGVTTDAAPLLTGVIGERQLKLLGPGVKVVRLDARAVITPLGKEALRRRGISIEREGGMS